MHPNYGNAVKQELIHCKNKNFNFKGVGLPSNFAKFSRKNRNFAKSEMSKYTF